MFGAPAREGRNLKLVNQLLAPNVHLSVRLHLVDAATTPSAGDNSIEERNEEKNRRELMAGWVSLFTTPRDVCSLCQVWPKKASHSGAPRII